jgi:hypothetical protein
VQRGSEDGEEADGDGGELQDAEVAPVLGSVGTSEQLWEARLED